MIKTYRSALDRMKKGVDGYGRTIWIEEAGYRGKPNVFYKYDSRGRLMKFTRKIFGCVISEAEFEKFGEEIEKSPESL